MIDLLFHEFKLNDSGKLDPKDYEDYQLAKTEFNHQLGKKRNGTGLIKDIFALVDRLTGKYLKNHKIACHEGCPLCCFQLVCCNTLEMKIIMEHLFSLHRRDRSRICKNAMGQGISFYYKNEGLLSGKRLEEAADELRKAHYGKPCIFLSEELKCSIYPARPLDCRSARSLDQCGKPLEEKPQLRKLKFFFDQIASELITNEEEKTFGKLQVIPLIGWPISEQFGDFFSRYLK